MQAVRSNVQKAPGKGTIKPKLAGAHNNSSTKEHHPRIKTLYKNRKVPYEDHPKAYRKKRCEDHGRCGKARGA